ncbi:5'-nucleotidase [Nocardioides aurantiacus]|uniref:5'-nucleotidase n=1 Tax=Nocardioides aurantiacus TaxID=86796 RepID=UPI00319D9728
MAPTASSTRSRSTTSSPSSARYATGHSLTSPSRRAAGNKGTAMAYELENRLVVGVASSALFDLTESDAYFRKYGEMAYREYRRQTNDAPRSGTARRSL